VSSANESSSRRQWGFGTWNDELGCGAPIIESISPSTLTSSGSIRDDSDAAGIRRHPVVGAGYNEVGFAGLVLRPLTGSNSFRTALGLGGQTPDAQPRRSRERRDAGVSRVFAASRS